MKRQKVVRILGISAAILLAFVSFAPVADGQEPEAGLQSDLAETGKKLSNPIGDVWALFARFDLNFADGELNSGDPKVGSKMIFQPILPFPLYGSGANKWNFITRPIIPVLFSASVPTGFNTFDRKGGSGDVQLPMVSRRRPGSCSSARGPPSCSQPPPTMRSVATSGAPVRPWSWAT